jgi:hypothetical protein
VLVCASREGELSFWVPPGAVGEKERREWTMTDVVHTERREIRLARCSSAKKTVLGMCPRSFIDVEVDGF